MSHGVLISGIFRSGTTLLCRALSANPKVKVSYQPLFPLFKAAVQAYCLPRGISFPMGDPMLTERHCEDFAAALPSIRFDGDALRSLKTEIASAALEDKEEKDSFIPSLLDGVEGGSFLELLEASFAGVKRACGRPLPGVKEIWCEDFFPPLAAAGHKCIHVVRDPRGVASSRNCGKYLERGCGGRKYPLLFIARAWRRSVLLRERLDGSPNYFFLRFEDFLSAPEATMRKACSFLDIEFSPAMLDFSNYAGGDGRRWEGNADSESFRSIDPSRSDRWKGLLSEDEVFLMEFLCSKELESLGYGLSGVPLESRRFMDMKEDPGAASSWLARFGHTLTEREKMKEIERLSKNG